MSNRGQYYKQKYGNKRQRQASYQPQRGTSIRTPRDLAEHLSQLNHKPYGAYQDLLGHHYTFRDFTLVFEKVQKDPFATASQIRVLIQDQVAKFPSDYYFTTDRRTALSDYLTRQLVKQIHALKMDQQFQSQSWHDVKGGNFEMTHPGQQILERNSIIICDGTIEARFTFNLPARGRTIVAQRAIEVLTKQLPVIITRALKFTSHDPQDLQAHIQCYEDQQWLRRELPSQNLIAFVPDGAILPRASGISDQPLTSGNVVPFASPDTLKIKFMCPSGMQITGMGIRPGVTMIAGGGYHGKSTLLESLEQGIYNHIPGDGREFLVCDPTLCKVRSEDGRSIEGIDISVYIDNLPFDMNTKSFSTQDASGSTSMAASIQELVEVGSKVLVYDEDTCATNFMIRDQRMQRIIKKENEPITPLIYKIRSLYEEMGVSSILVIGGCGDYIDVSDTIIEMRSYVPRNITQYAKEIASQYPNDLRQEGGESYGNVAQRTLDIPAYTKGKVIARGGTTIVFDKQEELPLATVTSLIEQGQTRWIGSAIKYLCQKSLTKQNTLKNTLEQLDRMMERDPKISEDSNSSSSSSVQMLESPMDFIEPEYIHGEYVRPTLFQVAQAINRLRGIRVIN
ncbi:hypothetical protein BDA99DRAFT_458347 [Phascolomyces articulosus]|uniref:ATPase of the ABC class n=1 Tax=Phascolomyces articulosus TaxID=60185 RepID=A0AAD5PHV3_9FUNG|nr:hypothetical protein BDA99DRAFT_458347 [Phascolomyces articulosus]